MSQTPFLKDILQSYFRANSGYELVLYDRLPIELRSQLEGLSKDPDFYGVLWPHVPGLVLKSTDQNTALLFLSLQQPGHTPAYIRNLFGERCNQAMAELVLDNVLEMAYDLEGNFVSGSAAYPLIYIGDKSGLGEGSINQLSMDALRYVQELDLDSSNDISRRLYYYNTIPISMIWRQRLPTPEAVLSFLGIQSGGRNSALLERDWLKVKLKDDQSGWLIWRTRHESLTSSSDSKGYPYKLYISPKPEYLPDICPFIIDAFSDSHIRAFKFGRDIYGLLRPDKIVAYCSDFDELAKLADHLQVALKDCPSQGVPFTAGIVSSGLLSWGMDPPDGPRSAAGLGRESWRLWVTNRLAVAILAAKRQNTDIPAWQFALERIRLEGLDTHNWVPSQTIWHKDRSA